MSAESPTEKSAVNLVRTFLGIGGVVALIVGILILVWPAHAAMAVTAIFAIYAIIDGLVYAGLGIFSKSLGGWARIGHIVVGILLIIVGVVALSNLATTAAWLFVFIAIFIGITWIVEGVVSLTTIGGARSKTWTLFFAIVSIIAGIVLLISPVAGAVALWWFLGIALVVLGIVQIVRAFSFKTA